MSMRAINKFGDFYSKGYTGADGKKLMGRDAVLAAAKDMSHTQMSEKDVKAAASFRMGADDAKMAVIRENFDKAVREKVIPALMALIPEFERLVPQLVDLNAKAIPAFVDLFQTIGRFVEGHKEAVDWMASNPIPTIIGASLAQSLGPAVLGEFLKVGIAKAFGDAGLGATFMKGLSTQIGQAGLIVGAAAIAIHQGMIAIDKEYDDENKLRQAGKVDQGEAAGVIARLKNGTATDEDRKNATQLVAKLQADAAAVQAQQENPGFFHKMGGAIAGMTEEGRQAQLDEQANNAKQLGDLTKTLRDLQTAVQANTVATKTKDTGGGGGKGGDTIVKRNGVK
jgi:hypothetical protein